MIDKLYQLALEYKKTRLWKSLWETEMFAVKLSGGRIGYISIMGSGGEHIALSLQIGEEAFLSFRRLAMIDTFLLPPLKMHELSLQQDCMQCSLENKDMLEQQEYEDARDYFRRNGIRPSGKNSYPMFRKYAPNHFPWPLQTQEEQEDLCEALSAAIALSGLLKGKRKTSLGLKPLEDDTEEILLLESRDGGYVLGKTPLPAERPVELPKPKAGNDIALASLKKIKRAGLWECEIIRFLQPVQNNPEEVPYFPSLLMAAKSPDGYILSVPPVKNYEEDPEELLNQFVDAMLQEKICPARIKARDERTYAFAESLCKKLKIHLEIDEDLPALDEAEENLLEHFSMLEEDPMEEFSSLLYDMLSAMEYDTQGDMPDEMAQMLKALRSQGFGPETEYPKLKKIWEAPPKWDGPDQSFVIHVSLETGCYRHIQIAGDCTLYDLSCAILEAFDFDNDHAHAFFMDNVCWSDRDSYYIEEMENGERPTHAYMLNQAGLHKGKKFKYLFDFGDEWLFQCKVLRIINGELLDTEVIKRMGEPPEQYPVWDEDEDWD